MGRRLRRRFVVAVAAVGALLVTASPAVAAGPNTTITSGPRGFLASRTATFRFKASVPGAAFQCNLDAKGWRACSSPKRYTKLSQGAHTFRVRAIKNGAVDRTPATRSFKVDTVKPDTIIGSGPSGTVHVPVATYSPSFTFSASEPGSFQCRLTSSTYSSCSSPYSPPSPLPEGTYTFQVRARDLAGNLDPTPAARTFTVERYIVPDQETAVTAAAIYFADQAVIDAPSVCPQIDCPSGRLPASDQLAIGSTWTVTQLTPQVFRVTVTSDVESLAEIVVSSDDVHCAVTMMSAYGATPTWSLYLDLYFEPDPTTGGLVIKRPFSPSVSGVEAEDWGLAGWGLPQECGAAGIFSSAYIAATFGTILDAHLDLIGDLCSVPGPDYLGPCP